MMELYLITKYSNKGSNSYFSHHRSPTRRKKSHIYRISTRGEAESALGGMRAMQTTSRIIGIVKSVFIIKPGFISIYHETALHGRFHRHVEFAKRNC
jgi:hypothetical protein